MTNGKQIIEATVSALWPKSDLARVLYYHSVHPELNGSHTVEDFARQLDWLLEHQYTVVTFSDLLRKILRGEDTRKHVSITFDDGYEDNFLYALPELTKRGLKATFFLVAKAIVSDLPQDHADWVIYPDRKFLNVEQINKMVEHGMEMASHTNTHVNVYKAFRFDRSECLNELKASKKTLEDITGLEISSFAYPCGQRGVFSSETKELLQEVGYEFAATTIFGGIDVGVDPYEVNRVEVRVEDDLQVFSAKLMGKYDFMRYYCLLFDRSKNWGRKRYSSK